MMIPQAKEITNVKIRNQNNVICFFDIRGILHFKFVPKGTTVNQTFYMEVLKRLIDGMKHKRGELWRDCLLILHQDNVTAYSSL
jgi:hypothetical protein